MKLFLLSILAVFGIGVTYNVKDAPIDVFIQDQTSRPIELFLFLNEGSFELATGVDVDDNTFIAEAGHSITVGDVVCFQDSIFIMQAIVLNVNVNTITIDSPFDYAFKAGAGCAYGTRNLSIDGSVTPQVFAVSPQNLIDGVSWDITRMMIVMNDDEDMYDNTFGGIPALTNGVQFRVSDGFNTNLFNIKQNSDYRLTAYDVNYTDPSVTPINTTSLSVRKSFGGQDKYGVVIRLESKTNDKFEAIVRDDIRGNAEMYIKIQGHFSLDINFL